MNELKIQPENLLVISDDLNIPFGTLRLRKNGSAGGHNGIKSIIAHTGTQQFKRIRVGIDRHPRIPVVDYVLGKFTNEETPLIEDGVKRASKAAQTFLEKDFKIAMNVYN